MKKIYKINSRLVKLPNAEQKQKGKWPWKVGQLTILSFGGSCLVNTKKNSKTVRSY